MNRHTVERLIEINRTFYRQFAGEFDRTRRSPWPGWRRVLAEVDGTRRLSILDVGCGNGRFGRFAAAELPGGIAYWGVDSSPELLASADAANGTPWILLEAELLADAWPTEMMERQFDLVACFGVMHHLPAEANRRVTIERLAKRLAPGGLFAVSFWQFGSDERFGGRTVAWSDVGWTEDEAAELEAGDRLLRWGQAAQQQDGLAPALRYCHHTVPEEADRLTEGLGLERLGSFRSDGRTGDLNLYHLLRRV